MGQNRPHEANCSDGEKKSLVRMYDKTQGNAHTHTRYVADCQKREQILTQKSLLRRQLECGKQPKIWFARKMKTSMSWDVKQVINERGLQRVVWRTAPELDDEAKRKSANETKANRHAHTHSQSRRGRASDQ